MKRNVLIILLALAILPIIAGNSIFSYDGYPIRYYGRDIYSLGMGDTGASDVFRFNNGYANPAIHSSSNLTLFSTGLVFGYTAYNSNIEDTGEKSFVDNSLDLPYFSISIPYKKHRFGFQFNSYASGLVNNQVTFTDSLTDQTITEQQEMDRYIYKADLIYNVRFGSTSLGVSGNYFFGHENRSFIQQSGSGLFDTREQLVRSFKNPSISFGVIQKFPHIAIGLSYTMPVVLDGDEIRSSIHETEDPVDYSYEIPGLIGASITGLPLKNIKIAADVSYEDWNRISPDYVSSYKIGIGIAYEPIQEEYQTIKRNLPYRFGLSWRKLPFVDNYSKEINELGVSAGFSVPLQREANRLDFGLQYTSRGSISNNNMSDNSFMMMIGFTGFDILSKAPDRKAPREIPTAEDL